jgi:hypothetical protein
MDGTLLLSPPPEGNLDAISDGKDHQPHQNQDETTSRSKDGQGGDRRQ